MTIMSRRAALRGIAATATATAALAAPATAATTSTVDAVLAAWRAWRPLEEEDWRISAASDEIHARHPRTKSIPTVQVFEVECMSDEEIDRVCRRSTPAWMQPAIQNIQECAKRELAAERARAAELDEQTGMAQLQQRWDEIDPIRGPLFDLIEDADGSSPIIIAAKLDVALACLGPNEDLTDCGPSGTASAIRGLLPELPADMRERLAPIAAGEGTIREIYTRDSNPAAA